MVGTERATAHVESFNAAVSNGDWASFSERFAEDAEMVFEGVPAGPYVGRAAIAAAYDADPPREPLTVAGPVTEDGHDLVVPFRWAESGGTGRMRLRFDETGLVDRLVVAFD